MITPALTGRKSVSNEDIALIANLMRRAGFGARRDELDDYAATGYDATVDELLDFGEADSMAEDSIRRYHHDHSAMFESNGSAASRHRSVTRTEKSSLPQ